MKKFVAVFCLLFCAVTLQAKDKLTPADYPIKIHISASHIDYGPGRIFVADTVLNGNKVQLAGYFPPHSFSLREFVLKPGVYQIRLIEDGSEGGGLMIRQGYGLLLPNGEEWRCGITSITE